MRLLTKDGRELASGEERGVMPSASDMADLGVRWIVVRGDYAGTFEHWLVSPNGDLADMATRRDGFSFLFADCILRRLCHSKARRSGYPVEWAELALDIAVPRLWSRLNRDMTGVGELAYAIVLRDHAYASVFRGMSEEREACRQWIARRGPSRILPEQRERVDYSPAIGSKREAYRLIGYDRLDTSSYCG